MFAVPAGYDDLLERPLYGHLASIRPDGSIQVSPMWFEWDGELLRFAHTTKRQKYRNVQINPQVAMSVSDPDDPYRYLELRGEVVRLEPDPTATFFRRLYDRYSDPAVKRPPDAPPPGEAPADAPDWVVIVVRPTGFSKH
jgi:PPOX class probable F420-dependent enzyme